MPENLPGPLYARKVQRRAASTGFDFDARARTTPSTASSRSCARPRTTARSAFHEVGDVLFAAVNVARKLKVDPELALRAAADRFRGRVEAAADLAAADGARLERSRRPTRSCGYYAQARLNKETRP